MNNYASYFFTLTIVFLFSRPLFSQNASFNVGLVVCGAEFGERQLPGKLLTDYIYPSKEEINYFAAKGFSHLTLPFKWERVQRKIGGELDSNEINRMKLFIRTCDTAHINVILTLQNFAIYTVNSDDYALGSRHLSFDTYKDFWKRMAITFSDCTNIYGFDIMNEPRGIYGRHWLKAAQHAIDGIREADNNTYIIVDGQNSSFSADWRSENNKLRKLSDKSNKIIYDAHCYFDYNHSGRYDGLYEGKISKYVGVDRVKPFVKWLSRHNKKGMIGEFGVPADKKWMEAMDKFLAYSQEKGLSVSYWAAGPWWNDYPLSIEPSNNTDKPQMNILAKYLPQATDSLTKQNQ